jgi:hypothetical protein
MSTALSFFVKRLMQKTEVQNIINYPMGFRNHQAESGYFRRLFLLSSNRWHNVNL